MNISITDYLDDTAARFPQKVIFQDNQISLTAKELQNRSQSIASVLLDRIKPGTPVVIYLNKKIDTVCAFMGAAYADCYYTPIDIQMPIERVRMILNTLDPGLIIHDRKTEAKVRELGLDDKAVLFEDACSMPIDKGALKRVHDEMCITDLLYVFFTSGSTGVPKGVTVSHMGVIDCMNWVKNAYSIDETIIQCNQAPLYFDLSVIDVFAPVFFGSLTLFPPKSYYTFPSKILQYMDEQNVNFINWAPSALINVVNCNAFEVCVPKNLKTVLFIGEVMPCKQLNAWRKHYPDVLFVNAYGPTEAVYNCMYYNIDREFSDEEMLPLGKACENCRILLITEDDREAAINEIGEICVIGQCLSYGYYNNPEKTRAAFVQNPLNRAFDERMYRTGDLAFKNEKGEIVFAGRKDFQIKRLGYRIELGEIENAIISIQGIDNVCCIFDPETSDIIAVYTGDVSADDIVAILNGKLPNYMLPTIFESVDALPLNLNGKVDRPLLQKMFIKHDQ